MLEKYDSCSHGHIDLQTVQYDPGTGVNVPCCNESSLQIWATVV